MVIPLASTDTPRQPISTAPQVLSILGSTGSIGTQTLEVVRLFPDRFRIKVLAAGRNARLLEQQAREFRPDYVVIEDEDGYSQLKSSLGDTAVRVRQGSEALKDAAREPDADVVVAAIVGFAGLAPVTAALDEGKTVALANKETLVVAGSLVQDLARRSGGRLLPVDSEHSAIFQCLQGESTRSVESLILTASGGPFWNRPVRTFGDITREEALDHPNWSMGPKITIDSATMMNKGLEVIEARWLFDIPAEQIEVVVHPQSIIHSMVTFRDGTVKAQLGLPDMKGPIQYALSYPDRWAAPHERIDWTVLQRLDFHPPDLAKFPCLKLAFDALEKGGSAPAVLNAANEQAVSLFLHDEIRFSAIPGAISAAIEDVATSTQPTLPELYEVDARARRFVLEHAPEASDSMAS